LVIPWRPGHRRLFVSFRRRPGRRRLPLVAASPRLSFPFVAALDIAASSIPLVAASPKLLPAPAPSMAFRRGGVHRDPFPGHRPAWCSGAAAYTRPDTAASKTVSYLELDPKNKTKSKKFLISSRRAKQKSLLQISIFFNFEFLFFLEPRQAPGFPTPTISRRRLPACATATCSNLTNPPPIRCLAWIQSTSDTRYISVMHNLLAS